MIKSTELDLGNNISTLIAAGAGLVGTVTAYVQGKKTAKATELDNVSKAIQIWQDTAEALKSKLEDVDAELAQMKKNHEECESSKKKLAEKVDELDRKVCEIRK